MDRTRNPSPTVRAEIRRALQHGPQMLTGITSALAYERTENSIALELYEMVREGYIRKTGAHGATKSRVYWLARRRS